MATVFKARCFGASGFEKIIAIKTLLPEWVGEPEYERMFLEEARLQACLSHRNLLQAHELGSSQGVLWVRLDWVDGENLSTLANGQPVPEELALLIAEELCLGLRALHRAVDSNGKPLGLVHRDVSPSNVLLSREGEVRLVDFGIAKATLQRDHTRAGVRKGKYAYMSPEQVSGLALTPASDQFALGVTLVEMLTGARPFEGVTPLDTMDLVREAKPPALPELRDDVRSTLHRLLQRDHRQRFEDDDSTLDAIEKLRSTRPASTRALSSWVQKRMKREQ